MAGKQKKSGLDVGYLRTATANTLAASILATTVQETTERLLHEHPPEQIAIERLLDNPYQPRASMDEESLQQLADIIASQGFHGLLVARPHPEQRGMYQITAGHRRRKAAQMAGLKTLPVIIHPWSDQEMATLAATENIQREDLTPLEEGRLFQLMVWEMHMSQEEIAASIKKHRSYVRNRLRLADAPADVQSFALAKPDSLRAVTYLLDLDDEAERTSLIEQLLQKTLTTDDLLAYVESRKQGHLPPTSALTPQEPPDNTAPQSKDRSTASEPPENQSTDDSSAQKNAGPSLATSALSEKRIRLTRLRTTLRSLRTYQKHIMEQQTPSQEERVVLRQILALAQELSSS